MFYEGPLPEVSQLNMFSSDRENAGRDDKQAAWPSGVDILVCEAVEHRLLQFGTTQLPRYCSESPGIDA